MALPTGGVPVPVSAQPAPSAAQLQSTLDNGIWYALRLWPVLEVAVANSWGGPDSADKRDWFAGALSSYLTDSTKKGEQEVDIEDVEAFVLQVLLDEFEVNVEDESEVAAARDVWGVWKGCRDAATEGRLGVEKAGELKRRFESRGKVKVEVEVQNGPDQEVGEDEDWSDDEEDVQMGGVPQLVPAVVRERVEPEVDEEGFTKVQGKKKR